MSLKTKLCLSKIQAFFYYTIIGAAILFALTNILQHYSVLPDEVQLYSSVKKINIDTLSMTIGATAGGFVAKVMSFR